METSSCGLWRPRGGYLGGPAVRAAHAHLAGVRGDYRRWRSFLYLLPLRSGRRRASQRGRRLAGDPLRGFVRQLWEHTLIEDPARSAIHRAADLAEEFDVPLAFDVNFREHLWESAEDARKAVDPLLDRSRIIKLSNDEISPLLGTEDVEEAAGMLLDRGAVLVLISLGPEGAFYATREFSGDVPVFEVECVDATGAGDAFLAASLVHLSEGDWNEARVREAARRGTAAGAIACTGYGAMGTLPTKDELERFMSDRG